MSEESKDVRVAEEFLAVFTDKSKDKAKLNKAFLKGFLGHYKSAKVRLQKSPNGNNGIIDHLQSTYFLVNNCKNQNYNEDRKAESLGSALGYFLAVMDYGITNQDFNIQESGPTVIHACNGIAKELKEVGKNIRLTFIQSRINKIAKEHADKLSPEQQKMFAQIAAIFKTA